MPAERPYSLGNTQADYGSINATSDMSSSNRARARGRAPDNPREVSYEDDARYASAYRPVAAEAPIDPNGPREILSGRGLY
jgi:rare lipoprotein A